MIRRVFWQTAVLLLFLGFATLSFATHPRLNSTTPSGGQHGTELEIRLNGSRLDDIQEVIFQTPGIEVLKVEARTNSAKARIRIAKDCRLGEHLLRVRTATGVSDLRTFQVGPFKTTDEVEPNNETAKAQKIPLNMTVSGTVGQEDMDYFAIEAKRGDRISAEIEAMRLGRSAFDPYLALVDGSGAVVAGTDDTALLRQDGFLSIIAPKDGVYYLQVRETSYGGNSDYNYRLHVGNFPRPRAIYPPGGKASDKVSFTFIGDPSGDFSQEIKLPPAPQGMFGAFAEQGGEIAPSPNWIRVSSFPNVLEAAPNQDRGQATPADHYPPVALNGIISKKGEADWFRFKAKKDQPLDIHVFARRLRSPLDSVLEISDGEGNSIASNDDSAGPDSYLKFTASKDGEYFLRVRDQLRDGGHDFTYRIEVTPVQPSLTVSIPEVARNDSQTRQWIAVPRGNRVATLISARRANFNGDLDFSIDGLPKGVKLIADGLPAKLEAMPWVFEAASDAPLGGKLLEPAARISGETNKVNVKYRHNLELVQGPNNSTYYTTQADKLYVAVVREAPFRLRIVEPKVPIVQGGTMDLKIIAERLAGYDEPINVKMLWNPPGISSLPDVTIGKGQSSVEYHLNATSEAQVRAWKIAVLGSAGAGGGTVWISSQLAKLEVGEPFIAGKIETVATEPGQPAKLICKLDQKQPFEGKATVKLMGLPEKVTANDAQITKDDKEIVFNLNVDPKCPFGSHKALFCSASIKVNSEAIHQNLAKDGILRIVPPKKSGRPAETKVAAKSETAGK